MANKLAVNLYFLHYPYKGPYFTKPQTETSQNMCLSFDVTPSDRAVLSEYF